MTDPLHTVYGPGRDPDQAWFWEPDWQTGEREASVQIAAGGLTVYDSAEVMFADLDES